MRRALRIGVAVALLALVIPGPGAAPAAASVNVASDMHGVYDGCIAKIRSAGLGAVVDKLDHSKFTFKVVRTEKHGNTHTQADDNTDKRDGTGTGGTLYWYPGDNVTFSDGVKFDDCATLYHEMSHMSDMADGASRDDVLCNSQSKVSYAEVKATRAENTYRMTQPDLKDKLRTKYGTAADGGGDLPPPDSPCNPPPPYHKPGGGGCNKDGVAPVCGVSNGDPHLTTFDQEHYDFQAVGEFVLVTTPSRDLEVQVRQSAVPMTPVSVNSAVAAKVGADRIGVYLTATGMVVRRNGALIKPPPTAGPVHQQADGSIAITWPDGSKLVVAPIGSWGLVTAMTLADARRGKVSGLLGDFDGKPADDIMVRGGAVIAQPTFAALYPKYADSWRITQQESLFDYGPGQSTATFTDRSFPTQPTPADPPGSAAARAVCQAAGVTEASALQDCILDVALSGQAVFADAEATTQAVPSAPATGGGTVLTVTAGGTATLPFQGNAGENVLIDVPSSTLPDECGVVSLRAPDGTTLASGCVINGSGLIDRTALPTTGTYTVVIHSDATKAGTSTVRIDPTTDDLGTVTLGIPTTVTVAGPGDIAERTFQGTAGQKVFVDVPSTTLPDDCGVLNLLAPDGKSLTRDCVINHAGFLDGTVLPTTGQYTIEVDPSGRGTGTARLDVTLAVDQNLTRTIGGPPVTATITQAGAVSRVRFAGEAGQTVVVDASAGTLPDACGVMSLLQPDGTSLSNGCLIGGKGTLSAIVLPTTGTYTLLIDPPGRDTGSVVVNVHS